MSAKGSSVLRVVLLARENCHAFADRLAVLCPVDIRRVLLAQQEGCLLLLRVRDQLDESTVFEEANPDHTGKAHLQFVIFAYGPLQHDLRVPVAVQLVVATVELEDRI